MLTKYQKYTDGELFREYCSLFMKNYVYKEENLEELDAMYYMEEEIDTGRPEKFKVFILETIKKLEEVYILNVRKRLADENPQ